METNDRTYGKVRSLIERLGGTMEWQPGGGPGGEWILTLGEYSVPVAVRNVHNERHNHLDQLYVAAVPNPQKISDYPPDSEAELRADAPERLVRLLIDGE